MGTGKVINRESAGLVRRYRTAVRRQGQRNDGENLLPAASLHPRLHYHALRRHSKDLAAANQRLVEEITRRKAAEEALRASEQHSRRLLEQSRHMREQLRRLSHRLMAAQEEERRTISRELHDVVAQAFTSIDVQLAALKSEAAFDSRRLSRSIGRTQRLIARAVDIAHRFASELRPPALDELGLVPALHAFLKGFRRQTGLLVSLAAFAEVERLDHQKRTVLYRVAQEALTNVARHAHATRVTVRIRRRNGAICLTVQDNGKGFQPECVFSGGQREPLGLLGIRERLEMVGGNLTVTSAPGKGATLLAQMPLAGHGRAGPW